MHFVSRQQAISLQRDLAPKVIDEDQPGFKARLFCGIDVAYKEDTAFVAAVVWDSDQNRTVEKVQAVERALVSYLPGLLGFREGPLLLKISEKLKSYPDVFMVDGQGVAHPRRCGLACQFGLAKDKPTIGVAKSLLYGRLEGESILDPDGDEIGRIVKTASGKKFYVSVGNRVSLETSASLVNASLRDNHPYPLRQAHFESLEMKGSAAH